MLKKRIHVLKSRSRLQKRQIHQHDITLSNNERLKLSSGKFAKFSDGSAVITAGDTSVLTTVVSKNKSTLAPPLYVNYRQKTKAPLRRNYGLTGQMIDRSIRPMFDSKRISFETQCFCDVLSVDGIHCPDILAINGASAALTISDIPWNGPVGAVRVGCQHKSSEFIINPTRKQMRKNEMNLVVAGTKDYLTVMIEAEANNIHKEKFLDAVKFGLEDCSKISSKIIEWNRLVGKSKRKVQTPKSNDEYHSQIKQYIKELCDSQLRNIYQTRARTSQIKAVDNVMNSTFISLKEKYPNIIYENFAAIFHDINRNVITEIALTGKDINEISCEVGLYSLLHGSSLFQQGQTQIFCTVTLDSLESIVKADTSGIREKNFFLHYEIPPYATNSIGRTFTMKGTRELEHEVFAEKALRPVIPENYPFTIRLTSEVLELNGSSSTASICAGSMALLDAGVEIASPVAGVSIGLIATDGDYCMLPDRLIQEEFLYDINFKMAGTESGITAVQMYLKTSGLIFEKLKDSIVVGHDRICQILDVMNSCISSSKEDKMNHPIYDIITIPVNKRHKFIGSNGFKFLRFCSEIGVQIVEGNSEGMWVLFAPNSHSMNEVKELFIEMLEEDVEIGYRIGANYSVTVIDIQSNGINVQIDAGLPLIFIPTSQLTTQMISHPNDIDIQIGQKLEVKCYGRDPSSGSFRFSRKALMIPSILEESSNIDIDAYANYLMELRCKYKELSQKLASTQKELDVLKLRMETLKSQESSSFYLTECYLPVVSRDYQKLLKKRVTLQESIEHSKSNLKKLKVRLQNEMFRDTITPSSNIEFPFILNQCYEGRVIKITDIGVEVVIDDTMTIFVPSSWLRKTKFNLLQPGDELRLVYQGTDSMTKTIRFTEQENDNENMKSHEVKWHNFTTFNPKQLSMLDTWSDGER